MELITDIQVRKLNAVNLQESTMTYTKEEKKAILDYLKSHDVFAYTTAPVIDALTGEQVVEFDHGRTDGEYVWYESTIYYLEKYDLKLNKDFIEYIKKAS